VVKAEDSQLSGCGFKPPRCVLDGVSEASYYIGKRNKGSQMEYTKKKKIHFFILSSDLVIVIIWLMLSVSLSPLK